MWQWVDSEGTPSLFVPSQAIRPLLAISSEQLAGRELFIGLCHEELLSSCGGSLHTFLKSKITQVYIISLMYRLCVSVSG